MVFSRIIPVFVVGNWFVYSMNSYSANFLLFVIRPVITILLSELLCFKHFNRTDSVCGYFGGTNTIKLIRCLD